MKLSFLRNIIFLIIALGTLTVYAQSGSYLWLAIDKPISNNVSQISLPSGYIRDTFASGTFPGWLRHLPLKEGRPPVHLYNGKLKNNQNAHYAVLDIDTGSRDLQQCADAVIRLRAEYLYSYGLYRDICFNFTSGDKAPFEKWLRGYRPVVSGNKVRWTKSAAPDSSYNSFRTYLETVFQYAGTQSLSMELVKVADIMDIKPGDVFIKGGFPGHAVIVVDVATDSSCGKKLFLLAQSYMPAQEIHILKNPMNRTLNPWYLVNSQGPLITPEWTFEFTDLRRFR